ncbi:MAG: glutamate racemase [Clostridia bacterium]|nr:glutamate racemase [Clostridia bacterium]
MDNRPIGVFDSGIGGLSAVKELKKILPGESIIYFGDTGRVPYGTRSPETITSYAREDMEFLLKFDPKAIMVACGTVSSVALDTLKKDYPVKTVGVVKSAAKKASAVTENGKIGVISTGATHRSGAFKKAISEISDAEVFSAAAPLFIPLVENGYIDKNNEVTRLVAKDYIYPLLEKGIDTLILGCTHFPVIKELIADIAPSVTLIDSGKEAACHLKDYLCENEMLSKKTSGESRYFVSDTAEGFSSVAEMFLGEKLVGKVEKITF